MPPRTLCTQDGLARRGRRTPLRPFLRLRTRGASLLRWQAATATGASKARTARPADATEHLAQRSVLHAVRPALGVFQCLIQRLHGRAKIIAAILEPSQEARMYTTVSPFDERPEAHPRPDPPPQASSPWTAAGACGSSPRAASRTGRKMPSSRARCGRVSGHRSGP